MNRPLIRTTYAKKQTLTGIKEKRPAVDAAGRIRLTKAEREKQKERKDRNHDRYVVKTYGLDPGEYEKILAEQGGGCAICGKRPRARKLAVDHDHYDGRVRGLICFFCNTALGVWEFDLDTARRAIEYLARIVADHKDRIVYQPIQYDNRIVEQGDLPF